jgi:methyl-CpG-binding domain protein 4
MEGLTEYELQRLQHIQRNKEFMERLGLPSLIPNLSPACVADPPLKAAPKARRVKAEYAKEDVRRSARVKHEAPTFSGAELDLLDEGRDDDEAPRKRPKRQAEASDEERAVAMRAVLDNSRAWLQSSREALLKVSVNPLLVLGLGVCTR